MRRESGGGLMAIPVGQLARRALPIFVFAVVATSLVTGVYLATRQFLKDRQSAIADHPLTPGATARRVETRNGTRPTTQAGPHPIETLPGQTAAAAGQAAIQQQLKTIDDINRINEMNRRLMEQQR